MLSLGMDGFLVARDLAERVLLPPSSFVHVPPALGREGALSIGYPRRNIRARELELASGIAEANNTVQDGKGSRDVLGGHRLDELVGKIPHFARRVAELPVSIEQTGSQRPSRGAKVVEELRVNLLLPCGQLEFSFVEPGRQGRF